MHLSYVQDNGTAAMNFIVSQATSNAGGSSGGNGEGNPTVTTSLSNVAARSLAAPGFGNAMTALMVVALGLLLL